MSNNTNRTPGQFYTAYIVRDANSRKFLNRRVYTGRAKGIWGKIAESNIFYDERSAEMCAKDINRRRPSAYSAYFAEVRPISIMARRQKMK